MSTVFWEEMDGVTIDGGGGTFGNKIPVFTVAIVSDSLLLSVDALEFGRLLPNTGDALLEFAGVVVFMLR